METNEAEPLLKDLQAEVKNAGDDSPDETIERTAAFLERVNYAPTLVWPVPGFLRLNQRGVLELIERVALADAVLPEAITGKPCPERDRLRMDQMRLVVYHYLFLDRLRKGDPDAWDEIHELWQED